MTDSMSLGAERSAGESFSITPSVTITRKGEGFFDGYYWPGAALTIGVLVASHLTRLATTSDLGSDNLRTLIGPVVVLLLLAVVVRLLLWQRRDHHIVVTPDSVYVPTTWLARGKEFAFHDLTAFEVRGKGRQAVLLISNGRSSWVYPLRRLALPVVDLLAAVREVVQSDPVNVAHWQKLSARQQLSNVLTATRPIVSWILLALLVVGFSVQWLLMGYGSNPVGLLELGGVSQPLLKAGQWQRLFMAPFLHASWSHLISNVASLALLGLFAERLLGGRKFLLIYLFSGLGGSVLSVLLMDARVAVGASGAIYGVAGALALLSLRYRSEFPQGFALHKAFWLYFLISSVVGPMRNAQIGWHAHLGGFLVGLFMAFLLRPSSDPDSSTQSRLSAWTYMGEGAQLSLKVIAVVYVTALLSFAVLNRPAETRQLMVAHLEKTVDTPGKANSLAWLIATDMNSSAGQLQRAAAYMEPIVASIDNNSGELTDKVESMYLDTYAAVLFRQGDYANAIRRERQALLRENRREYRDRITWFMEEHYRLHGVLLTGTAQTGDVELVRTFHPDGRVELVVKRLRDNGVFNVAVLARHQGKREGFHACHFMDKEQLTLLNAKDDFGKRALDMDYTLMMIDTINNRAGYEDSCAKANVGSVNVIR
ncbi:MAG: rhomboid family intramembrane serine protease [Pseudomonadota bacterium]